MVVSRDMGVFLRRFGYRHAGFYFCRNRLKLPNDDHSNFSLTEDEITFELHYKLFCRFVLTVPIPAGLSVIGSSGGGGLIFPL